MPRGSGPRRRFATVNRSLVTKLYRKASLGALFWLVVVVLGTRLVQGTSTEARYAFNRTVAELWRGTLDPAPEYEVHFRGGAEVRSGHGVFVMRDGDLVRVGEVMEIRRGADGARVRLALDTVHDPKPLPANTRVVQRTQGQSLLFCLQVLLQPERWQQISDHWAGFRRVHEKRLITLLRPLLPRLLKDSGEFVEAELRRALATYQDELMAWVDRRRDPFTQERVLPLVLNEVWPIVREQARPAAEVIGQDLWKRAPLFDLAWRAAYDAMLANRPDKLETRWKLYVQDEVVPSLKEHEDLILTTVRDALKAVSRSPDVQEALRLMADDLLHDPELLGVLRAILSDVFVGNERFEEFVRKELEDEEIQERLLAVNQELQVFFDEIGNLLFYDETGDGINPDLARLLRILLLKKDKYFLFLEPGQGDPLEEGGTLTGVRQR